jgi:lipopolysaccharide export system permease protein
LTIFWYILRDYLKYVIGTIILTVFLFVLFDFIHRTTKYFAQYNPSTQLIVKFYLLQIPGQIQQALPIAALLGSVICMVLLSRTNEVTAMRAAGMGPAAIGFPLAFGGLMLSMLSLFIGEELVPQLAQKLHYVEQVQIEKEKDDQVASGAKWLRRGSTIVNFGDYDPIAQTLSRVRLIDILPNFRAAKAVEADAAVFKPETKLWTLMKTTTLTFKRNGTLDTVRPTGDMTIDLPVEPKKLKKDRRKPNELSFRELRDIVSRGEQSGIDILPYKIDYHAKFAYPFAALVVSLIGLKFGYRSERAPETVMGILFAFGIGFGYYFVLSAARSLGLRGDIHPFIAAWMANVVTLGAIGILTWRSRST